MALEPNYFTCTLGQAQSLGLTQPHKTVNSFVDAQAKDHPDLPAVGFAAPQKEHQWQYRVYTFAEIHRGSCNLANDILAKHPQLQSRKVTVGLLCPSTPEFLFLWLALMRVGCAVLLIAPQCRASAIKALHDQCDSTLLFYDEMYAEQAQEAAQLAHDQDSSIRIEALPLEGADHLENLVHRDVETVYQPDPPLESKNVAYFHHTSGTSSGVPKPVPQSHNAAVGVQPAFPRGREAATFTTTPLFHGGIADLFRAWTSSALIWLFPGKSVPITSANILRCLEVANRAMGDRQDVAAVKYFSSVPYVLQMLDAEGEGVKALKTMDMVGVGGAALPAEVGDRLVAKGVNLLSRYGSAECGFLMSSQRDFSSDGEWQYLRFPEDAKYLRLEEQADSGLRELVVLDGWPHMAKRNRDDGAYATADLFASHDGISGAWKYHSRSDSQLTLITGKKFDPAPLEAAIATSDLLEDVLVFGNGEPYPGALLFRAVKAKNMGDEELLEAIWPVIEKLNRDSPDHAQLAKTTLRPMAVPEQPLEKSSKGTVMRGAAEKAYKADIEAAYRPDDGTPVEQTPDQDVEKAVHEIVEYVAHRRRRLSVSVDLFSYGVDSVAGMQIRSRLQRLLPADGPTLPMTVVEDCGTVSNLAHYIVKRRHGETDDREQGSDDLARMRELVDDFSGFVDSVGGAKVNGHTNGTTKADVVVLTGATGALGAHVLHLYRQKPCVRKIYCLVRGADDDAARKRVNKALRQRKRPDLDAVTQTGPEIIVLPSQLSDSFLGLEQDTYDQLASEATVILHLAWSVNFRMHLRSFVKDNIGGVTNVINLALASPYPTPPRLGFCSSVAAVAAYNKGHNSSIPEAIISDPTAATGIGYSQSKWVAEQICARAAKETRLRGRMTVFRVGQLAGDREHGVWNASEAWPLMLKSALDTQCLPDLGGEVLDWLPVDVAAEAVIEGIEPDADARSISTLRMLHILNPHDQPTWTELLSWCEAEGFAAVPPADWVDRLEQLGQTRPDHPALKLLEHWRRAYGERDDVGGKRGDGAKPTGKAHFSVVRAKELVPVMREVQPVDEHYFGKLWHWIKTEM